MIDKGKEVDALERRIREYSSGDGECSARSDSTRPAGHDRRRDEYRSGSDAGDNRADPRGIKTNRHMNEA